MGRSISERVYDKARSKSLEDMTSVYPELWEFLLAKKVEEYRTKGHPVREALGTDNNRIYDKARYDAKADLRDMRPGAWAMLMWAWSEHFKVELGWVQPEHTPERNAEGRFASVS